MTLREAVDALGGCASQADSSHGRPRWLTNYGEQSYRDGSQESRSLHIPDSVSDSSARRIARLLGVVIR